MLQMAYTIHVMVSLFLILVVLLQQGKGADLSVFGGGGTQAAFGARGAATLLHRLTVWAFAAFIVTTMAIGFLQTQRHQGSVMRGVAGDAATVEEALEPPTPPAVDEPRAEVSTEAEGSAEAPASGRPSDEGIPPPPGE